MGSSPKRGLAVAVVAAMLLVLIPGGSVALATPTGSESGTVATFEAAALAATDDTVIPFIIGGTDAERLDGEVSIQFPAGRHRCGGNLILRQWVLTAAHCTVIITPGQTQIRVGSLNYTTGGELVGVSEVHIRPDYTGEVVRGDHALVKLDRPVRARTAPLALSPGKPGTLTRITGWGLTCKDPARPECAVLPTRLQQLDTVVADPERCNLGLAPSGAPIFDPKFEVCIASADGQARMACNGDSGGPLKRKFYGRWYLVATTSGDGDDLMPRPNDCNTNPAGDPGVGIWERTGPSLPWIVDVLFGAGDVASARELSATTLK